MKTTNFLENERVVQVNMGINLSTHQEFLSDDRNMNCNSEILGESLLFLFISSRNNYEADARAAFT